MTKQPVCGNGPGLSSDIGMSRRALLTCLPCAAVAIPLVAGGTAADAAAPDIDLARLVDVIEQLETVQGWEASGIVAAKAFAAWQMRKALGLALPDPVRAQMHVDFQNQNFEGYQRSAWFERDRDAGKVYEISPMERGLT
jgi:hypothetical protein